MFTQFYFSVFQLMDVLAMYTYSGPKCGTGFTNVELSTSPAYYAVNDVLGSTRHVGFYFKITVSKFENISFFDVWARSASAI